jgi:hypothetical protein
MLLNTKLVPPARKKTVCEDFHFRETRILRALMKEENHSHKTADR